MTPAGHQSGLTTFVLASYGSSPTLRLCRLAERAGGHAQCSVDGSPAADAGSAVAAVLNMTGIPNSVVGDVESGYPPCLRNEPKRYCAAPCSFALICGLIKGGANGRHRSITPHAQGDQPAPLGR